jgi:hypothetical protein
MLTDYAMVSSVPRRGLTKLSGGYFEGALATGVREVFERDWEGLLRVCAMTMEFVRETGTSYSISIHNNIFKCFSLPVDGGWFHSSQ